MSKRKLKNGNQTLPRQTMKPGTTPPPGKSLPVVGSGRNRPAKGFNQITKKWEQE